MPAAIFPGTFDPPTLGHLDIIQRASQLFQPLYVAIGHNPLKKPLFTIEERIAFLRKITSSENIRIVTFEGLLVDLTKKIGVNTIVRSFRTTNDMDDEIIQASMNKHMEGVETIFLVADEKYRLISSSHVREIARCGRHLHEFVPPEIEEAIFKKLSESGSR